MASDEHLPGRLEPNERLVKKHDLTLPQQHPFSRLLTRLSQPAPRDLPDPDPYNRLKFKYTYANLTVELHLLFFENDVLYDPLEEELPWLRTIPSRISEDLLKGFVLVVTNGDKVADSVVWRSFLDAREECKVGFVYQREAQQLDLADDEESLLDVVKLLTFWRSA